MNTDELQLLHEHAPEVPPMSGHARRSARDQLALAIQAESGRRRPRAHRRSWRWVPATGVAALVMGVVVGLVGPSPSPHSSDDPVGLLGPRSAAAVVEAIPGDGHTDLHFLDPTADPARIRAELAELGIDLAVTFVPADPFSVGRMVFAQGTEGIELLGETGSELEGGPIGIRVSDGWSGSGSMAIGRAAEHGEIFETGIPLNAERSGGPLHCTPVRGLSVSEGAEIVRGEGLEVEWRTTVGNRTTTDEPPVDFVVHDALWHATDTVILFADTGPAKPLPAAITEAITAGCAGDGR